MANEITRGAMMVTLSELADLIRQAKIEALESVISNLRELVKLQESRPFGNGKSSPGLRESIQVVQSILEETHG